MACTAVLRFHRCNSRAHRAACRRHSEAQEHSRLIEAFKTMPRSVATGTRGIERLWRGRNLDAQCRRSSRSDRVCQRMRNLQSCTGRASIFAFPSLDEGFRIPVLEAMAHGVPVIASSTSALARSLRQMQRYSWTRTKSTRSLEHSSRLADDTTSARGTDRRAAEHGRSAVSVVKCSGKNLASLPRIDRLTTSLRLRQSSTHEGIYGPATST